MPAGELFEAERTQANPFRQRRFARLVHNLEIASQLSLLVSSNSFHVVDEKHYNEHPPGAFAKILQRKS